MFDDIRNKFLNIKVVFSYRCQVHRRVFYRIRSSLNYSCKLVNFTINQRQYICSFVLHITFNSSLKNLYLKNTIGFLGVWSKQTRFNRVRGSVGATELQRNSPPVYHSATRHSGTLTASQIKLTLSLFYTLWGK